MYNFLGKIKIKGANQTFKDKIVPFPNVLYINLLQFVRVFLNKHLSCSIFRTRSKRYYESNVYTYDIRNVDVVVKLRTGADEKYGLALKSATVKYIIRRN